MAHDSWECDVADDKLKPAVQRQKQKTFGTKTKTMISIITPVYNTEKYLRECLESVLAQTYTDYEVLLVDDGSTDRSGGICDEYAQRDSRIRVFHKENGGVSSARNVGLDNARGEWVCFVDSDDTVAKCYLEVLLKSAIVNDADSSMGGLRYIDTDRKVEIVPSHKGIETVEENIKGFYACVAPDWQRYLWNRLLRAGVIKKNNLRFNERLYYKEDGLFLIQFLCASNGKVGVSNRIVYNYRQNGNSAMGTLTTSFNPKLLTNAKSHCIIVKTLRRHGYSCEVIARALAHAKQSSEWIKGIMGRTGCRRQDYRIKLELTLIDTIGIVEWLKYKKQVHCNG